MAKFPNLYGGGSLTNKNGLAFEQTTSLDATLSAAGYVLLGHHVFKDGRSIGLSVPKYDFYKHFLEPQGINYKDINSKKWLPDEAFVNDLTRTVYIIEKKFQHGAGSVDEKLPNCHFKKLEYEKLCFPIQYRVEYIYILSDWFRDAQYRDTLAYVQDMGCHYFFNEIPLAMLGL